jgi:chemotaxis protein methyltransferase CheR
MGNELLSVQTLSDRDYQIISSYIETNVGIKMPESKRVMIQSRLIPRLRHLKFDTYKQYLDYVFSTKDGNQELIFMINALTTNKTDFFREADHFTFLTSTVLHTLSSQGKKSIKLWSAGCSSGEEPYTIAIVLKEFMKNQPGVLTSFSIKGTDISTKVLDKAVNAVYDTNTVANIPIDIKKRYFLKSSDPAKSIVRIKPEIRSYCSFSRLNFMDQNYNINDTFQVIFCRNVLIYFDKQTQEAIIRKLLRHLDVDGYLFLGHSETIFSMDLPLENVAPAVYRKIGSR